MTKQKFPLEKAYTLMGSGPVVLITSNLNGKGNVMPIAWTTMLDFDPPIVGCCIGDQSYTFEIVNLTGRFAINIPTVEIADKVMGSGKTSGKNVDKFVKFGFTVRPASKIDVPLIEECYASLECRVVDASLVEKYNFFIAQILEAWVDKGVKNPKTLHHITGRKFILGGNVFEAK